MNVSVFNSEITRKKKRGRQAGKMRSTTIREFGGGWNEIDAPTALSTKYAKILKNWYRKPDGSQALRYGTTFKVDVSGVVTGDIVDGHYFNGNNIVVTEDGEIAAVDDQDVATAIWNTAIAALLPGAPTGWSSGLTFVSFHEIKGSLIIHNGVDKPVEVQPNLSVRYLQDLATGSNVNAPIGKYGTTVADYIVNAGIPAEPNTLYIGAKGTIGTFQGDPAPNDGTTLDVGAYAPEENDEIRGISSFRNFLFVHFFSATLKVILGEYDTEVTPNHIPRVDDTLQKFGLLSHRCVVPVVNDLLFGDVTGANTVRRNILSGDVEPSRLSELIAPAWQNQVASLTQDQMLTDIFAVHDRLTGHYIMFVPTGVGEAKRAFVFTFNERMRIRAWSEFVGWTWRAAWSSALGRVFFAKDTRIYQYGNEAYNEEYAADFLEEFDTQWANSTIYTVGHRARDVDLGTVWICLVGHTSAAAGLFADDRDANPTLWEEYEGKDVDFDWEFPWTDANSRAKLKRLADVGFDTQGTSEFNIDIFVDNIYKDENQDYDPALTLKFIAGDSLGYGGGDQPYGGGRRTTDERLWSHPVKFKIVKLRLHGGTKKPLRVVAITLLFAEGKYGR